MPQSPKILLVDDQVKIQELLSDILRNNFYNVEIASSGTEAKAVLKRKKFDLVITDLRMPYGDGYQLLKYIQSAGVENNDEQNVMIITAAPPSEVPADEINFREYITLHKPFTKPEFLSAVADALD